MKYSLSILVSALALAGCITNPSTKQNEAEPTATTAAASSTSSAPAGTAAAPAAGAADAPCTPAQASTTGKAKSTQKKASTTKSKSKSAAATPATSAPPAAPCTPAANVASVAAAKDQPAGSAATANRKEVKGINDWTGYVQGTPARNSKFAKLKIGMGEREVIDLIGTPTDQSMHMTGKAWIPFYVGSGKREVWFHYKGVGRLLFADNAGFTTDTGLIGIEHDASERGYK